MSTCDCCHKPDAKPIDFQGIKRTLCDSCAAFLFRCIADLRPPTTVIFREPYHQPPIVAPAPSPYPPFEPYRITC